MTQPVSFGKWNLGEVGLEARQNPTLDDFGSLIAYLRSIKQSSPWWIGDAVNYGEHNWSEEAAQVLHGEALEMTAWSLSSLRSYQWVCERVTMETRRADLSFGHHQKVAALDTRSQRTWLARALQGDEGVPWTVRRLTAELHSETRGGPEATFYVLVQCRNPKDQEHFLEKMQAEGRIAKAVTKGRAKEWAEQQAAKRTRKTDRTSSRSRSRTATKRAEKSTTRGSRSAKTSAKKTAKKSRTRTTPEHARASGSK